MSLLKIRGRVDKNGVLTAKLPVCAGEAYVDLLVDWPPKSSDIKSSFDRILAESFGSIPDLERSDQGELPLPKNW